MLKATFGNISITTAVGLVIGVAILVVMIQPGPAEATLGPSNPRPEIISMFPPDGAQEVPLDVLVRAVFSEPMDPRTFTPNSFRLSRSGSNVNGSLSYNSLDASVTFVPMSPLAP